MKKTLLKHAAINAGATALYVVLITTFLMNAEHLFGPDEPKTVLIPMMMLMLLVFSVAFVGTTLFGRPLIWYIDGKKKEALGLLGYTLLFFGILAACFVVAAIITQ